MGGWHAYEYRCISCQCAFSANTDTYSARRSGRRPREGDASDGDAAEEDESEYSSSEKTSSLDDAVSGDELATGTCNVLGVPRLGLL